MTTNIIRIVMHFPLPVSEPQIYGFAYTPFGLELPFRFIGQREAAVKTIDSNIGFFPD